MQLAAADESAIAAGDYLAVIGDVHPGSNPLGQGFFAHRYPEHSFLKELTADRGTGVPILLRPWRRGFVRDGRSMPLTAIDDIHIAAMPETRARGRRRTWLASDLLIDGDDVVDRHGELRIPLIDAFAHPIMVAGVRAFDLLPGQGHAPRVKIGRTVVRRAGWRVPASEVPQRPEDIPAFARDRGMPRRLFIKSPSEHKPMYFDTESPVLARLVCRQARQAAAESPPGRMSFTEMLPTPEQCWLQDPDGLRYVSELRLVAVDAAARPRRAGASGLEQDGCHPAAATQVGDR